MDLLCELGNNWVLFRTEFDSGSFDALRFPYCSECERNLIFAFVSMFCKERERAESRREDKRKQILTQSAVELEGYVDCIAKGEATTSRELEEGAIASNAAGRH